MSSFYQQNKYWIIGGMGVITLAAVLYYLSLDDEEDPRIDQYDPAVHTIEQLRKIAHEIYVEGATLHCQKLR